MTPVKFADFTGDRIVTVEPHRANSGLNMAGLGGKCPLYDMSESGPTPGTLEVEIKHDWRGNSNNIHDNSAKT